MKIQCGEYSVEVPIENDEEGTILYWIVFAVKGEATFVKIKSKLSMDSLVKSNDVYIVEKDGKSISLTRECQAPSYGFHKIQLDVGLQLIIAFREEGEEYEHKAIYSSTYERFINEKRPAHWKKITFEDKDWELDISQLQLPSYDFIKGHVECWVILEIELPEYTYVSFVKYYTCHTVSLESIASMVSESYAAAGPNAKMFQDAEKLSDELYIINVCQEMKIYIGSLRPANLYYGEYVSNNQVYLQKFINDRM